MKVIDSTAKMQVVTYSELSEEDKTLIDKAKEAMKGAYAPYSNFCVGAAVSCGENIVIGSNQENEAYPSGMCAERVALYSASAQYPAQKIEAIAISAYSLVKNEEAVAFPCGACRQVLLEYEKRQNSPIRIIVASKDEVYIIESAKTLMPFSFNM
ncbi:MAG: cytidine deaminase [Bacteroidales bacterium]|nr:cytidine deaminase [Bacteroidales bacterium]